MPVYIYRAKVTPQKSKIGTIEADTERAAINKLLKSNLHPVSIKLQSAKNIKVSKNLKRISKKEISIFLNQLSNLNQAGLSLVRSLDNIAMQNSNIILKDVVMDIRDKIKKGKSFSEAIAEYTILFNSMEINMIKAAESTGSLPEVIAKIVDLREKDMSLR